MFDAEMIRTCAELYPVEFYGLCIAAAILIPAVGYSLFVVAKMLVEGD